jgi:hypothetical protein
LRKYPIPWNNVGAIWAKTKPTKTAVSVTVPPENAFHVRATIGKITLLLLDLSLLDMVAQKVKKIARRARQREKTFVSFNRFEALSQISVYLDISRGRFSSVTRPGEDGIASPFLCDL